MRISDWSSDVCSSDLSELGGLGLAEGREKVEAWAQARHRRSPFWCDRARGAGRRLGNRSQPAIVTTAESSSFTESKVRSVSTHEPTMGELYYTRRNGHDRIERRPRSEEHTSELQSLLRNSYAVF